LPQGPDGLSAVGADDYREGMRADDAGLDGRPHDLYSQAEEVYRD